MIRRSFFWLIAMALYANGCISTYAAAAELLNIVETDSTITVNHGDKTVLVYNKVSPPVPEGLDPIYNRSGFLHPIVTPKGRTITQAFPADHPHQHGIFFAWVKTKYGDRSVDFWNLAGRTGRVVHDRVVNILRNDEGVAFEVDLIHRAENPTVDVLLERWKITVPNPVAELYCFDIDSEQRALTETPLVIEKYHYGGMAFRGLTKWLTNADREKIGSEKIQFEPSAFLNNSGQARKEGNHTPSRWVAFTGTIDQQPVSITVMSAPQNFRSPQPARLHDSKPYFCFSPCVTDAFEISKSQPLRSKYRYLITDTPPETEWIEARWLEMTR